MHLYNRIFRCDCRAGNLSIAEFRNTNQCEVKYKLNVENSRNRLIPSEVSVIAECRTIVGGTCNETVGEENAATEQVPTTVTKTQDDVNIQSGMAKVTNISRKSSMSQPFLVPMGEWDPEKGKYFDYLGGVAEASNEGVSCSSDLPTSTALSDARMTEKSALRNKKKTVDALDNTLMRFVRPTT